MLARRIRTLLALGLAWGCGAASESGTKADSPGAMAVAVQAPAPPTSPATATPSTVVPRPDAGFRSKQRLAEHYARHGHEFGGSVTEQEYLAMAQALRDRPAGGDVLEIVREDGTVSRFDRGSGAFLVYGADGTIRTFFRPSDGERYFRRQAARREAR